MGFLPGPFRPLSGAKLPGARAPAPRIEMNPSFPDRPRITTHRIQPSPSSGAQLEIGHYNVATDYLTNSRRKTAFRSGSITAFSGFIASAKQGGEAKLVQRRPIRALFYRGFRGGYGLQKSCIDGGRNGRRGEYPFPKKNVVRVCRPGPPLRYLRKRVDTGPEINGGNTGYP